MGWAGFFERFLYSCFGDRDEPTDPGATPPRPKVDTSRPANPEPPNETVKDEQQGQATVAESSGTTSERQQSEQSQSDATQSTTQTTSAESSAKVNSDADEITPSRRAPQSSSPTAVGVSDPDEITPVTPSVSRYANVKDALEDRRKLYERLRRKPEGESSISNV